MSTARKRGFSVSQSAVAQRSGFDDDVAFKAIVDNDIEFFQTCADGVLQARDVFGASLLHIHFLLNKNKPDSMKLTRLLVKRAPYLVNAVYEAPRYHGEACLHIVAVNRDMAMVRYLVEEAGADFTSPRADGEFFAPGASCYYGESVLSFAACRDAEDIVQYLVHKGLSPDFQDSYGNTALHMCVIHGRKRMFDLLVDELAADQDIKNSQGYTPYMLAARLGNVQMFSHIMERTKEINWKYGPVTSVLYPLSEIDSLDSGRYARGEHTALDTVVFSRHASLLSLPIFEQILDYKWRTFARDYFHAWFFLELLYTCIFMASMFYTSSGSCDSGKGSTATEPVSSHALGRSRLALTYSSSSSNPPSSSHPDASHSLCTWSFHDRDKTALDMLVVIGAFLHIVPSALRFVMSASFLSRVLAMMQQIVFIMHGRKHSAHTPQASTNMIDMRLFLLRLLSSPWLFSSLVITSFALRLVDSIYYENVLSFAGIALSLYLLYFARGFRSIGPYVVILSRIISGDFFRFIIIYLCIMLGFSQAFYNQFEDADVEPFSSWPKTTFSMLRMSLGEFKEVVNEFDQARSPTIISIFYLCYMALTAIVLLNMLIAMMTETFAAVSSNAEGEWKLQRADIILYIERTTFWRRHTEYPGVLERDNGEGKKRFLMFEEVVITTEVMEETDESESEEDETLATYNDHGDFSNGVKLSSHQLNPMQDLKGPDSGLSFRPEPGVGVFMKTEHVRHRPTGTGNASALQRHLTSLPGAFPMGDHNRPMGASLLMLKEQLGSPAESATDRSNCAPPQVVQRRLSVTSSLSGTGCTNGDNNNNNNNGDNDNSHTDVVPPLRLVSFNGVGPLPMLTPTGLSSSSNPNTGHHIPVESLSSLTREAAAWASENNKRHHYVEGYSSAGKAPSLSSVNATPRDTSPTGSREGSACRPIRPQSPAQVQQSPDTSKSVHFVRSSSLSIPSVLAAANVSQPPPTSLLNAVVFHSNSVHPDDSHNHDCENAVVGVDARSGRLEEFPISPHHVHSLPPLGRVVDLIKESQKTREDSTLTGTSSLVGVSRASMASSGAGSPREEVEQQSRSGINPSGRFALRTFSYRKVGAKKRWKQVKEVLVVPK